MLCASATSNQGVASNWTTYLSSKVWHSASIIYASCALRLSAASKQQKISSFAVAEVLCAAREIFEILPILGTAVVTQERTSPGWRGPGHTAAGRGGLNGQ